MSEVIVLSPGEGEVVGDAPDRRVEILCDRDELVVTWTRFGPRRDGAQPHVHHTHSDLFYVLAGELTLVVGPEREERVLAAGTLAFAPPLLVHGFRNAADAELRYLNLHAPGARFADFLRGRNPGFDQVDPPADGGRPVTDALIVPPGTRGVLVDRAEIRVEARDEPGPPSGRLTCLYALERGGVLEIHAQPVTAGAAGALSSNMRTLATIMVSISLVTTALFAHALAAADEDPAPLVQVASK